MSDEEKKDVSVPAKFTKLVEEIEKMSVLDLSELVKVLEDKFGVSASAPAAVLAAPDSGGDAPAEEKDSYDATLTKSGEQKVQVIKAVKEVLGLGLKEAKDLVDGVPTPLKQGLKKEEAEELKKKIEGAGGTIELK